MIGKCLQILGYNLVGGDWNHGFFLTFLILGLIIPDDELIFFRGVGIPPTRWVLILTSKIGTPKETPHMSN